MAETMKQWLDRWWKAGGFRRQHLRNILMFCDGDREGAEIYLVNELDGELHADTLFYILLDRIRELEERVSSLENPLGGILEKLEKGKGGIDWSKEPDIITDEEVGCYEASVIQSLREEIREARRAIDEALYNAVKEGGNYERVSTDKLNALRRISAAWSVKNG